MCCLRGAGHHARGPRVHGPSTPCPTPISCKGTAISTNRNTTPATSGSRQAYSPEITVPKIISKRSHQATPLTTWTVTPARKPATRASRPALKPVQEEQAISPAVGTAVSPGPKRKEHSSVNMHGSVSSFSTASSPTEDYFL